MAQYLMSVVTVCSSDIEKSRRFYETVLGLRQSYRFPREGAPEHIESAIGGTTVAISSPAGLQSHGMPAASAGHPFEIGIMTDDVDGAVASLRAAGVPIVREPSDSAAGNRYAYVADPDGNWISMYQTHKAA